jgi:drug/metabolite transporter (DMT)-like permease
MGPGNSLGNGKKYFNGRIFWLLFLGGSFEFFGNHAMTIGFKAAEIAHINAGMVNALLSANTIYVLLASYFIFNEKPYIL